MEEARKGSDLLRKTLRPTKIKKFLKSMDMYDPDEKIDTALALLEKGIKKLAEENNPAALDFILREALVL